MEFCVCCLLKSENKKRFRTFTTVDGRLYHELTQNNIDFKNKPKICFDCKSSLKTSTDFLHLCIKSYEDLKLTEPTSEIVEKIKRRRTRQTIHEYEQISLEENSMNNDVDTEDERTRETPEAKSDPEEVIQEISENIQQELEANISEQIEDKREMSKSSKRTKLLCPECGLSFPTSQRLKIHSLTHSGVKSWNCQNCDKVFATKFRLKAHSRTHTGERPFICDICSLAFAQGNALKCHKRIHTKERPFVCKICSKSFSQNTTLKTHMVALHLGKTVECDVPGCTKKFTRRSYLLLHKRDHAGERKYSCDRCPNQYKQKSHLDRHIEASHLGIRHKCDFPGCSAEFSKAWSLKMHKFVHTSVNDLPYQCKLCGTGFQRRDKLLKHIAKIHPESSEKECVKVKNEIAKVVISNPEKTNFVLLTSSPEIYTIRNLDGSLTQVQTLQVIEDK